MYLTTTTTLRRDGVRWSDKSIWTLDGVPCAVTPDGVPCRGHWHECITDHSTSLTHTSEHESVVPWVTFNDTSPLYRSYNTTACRCEISTFPPQFHSISQTARHAELSVWAWRAMMSVTHKQLAHTSSITACTTQHSMHLVCHVSKFNHQTVSVIMLLTAAVFHSDSISSHARHQQQHTGVTLLQLVI